MWEVLGYSSMYENNDMLIFMWIKNNLFVLISRLHETNIRRVGEY